ncbi:hypothetical protein BDK51DRAFT_30324 [Blyttiomyces helicus]|uniref:F-box domain-containing protein n=1 Tax=Blyttiomyces helicus TaxID=388810 RepID=A0A4P9WP67_9FUNG|nr:hypothetical protein BDK51DRAFT_30324 [Blyttiomyces helicus]|eukprot:RKO93020.1 hypothetical protein BDK51DRAFT_30324 [Blyttiomyces helicus]
MTSCLFLVFSFISLPLSVSHRWTVGNDHFREYPIIGPKKSNNSAALPLKLRTITSRRASRSPTVEVEEKRSRDSADDAHPELPHLVEITAPGIDCAIRALTRGERRETNTASQLLRFYLLQKSERRLRVQISSYSRRMAAPPRTKISVFPTEVLSLIFFFTDTPLHRTSAWDWSSINASLNFPPLFSSAAKFKLYDVASRTKDRNRYLTLLDKHFGPFANMQMEGEWEVDVVTHTPELIEEEGTQMKLKNLKCDQPMPPGPEAQKALVLAYHMWNGTMKDAVDGAGIPIQIDMFSIFRIEKKAGAWTKSHEWTIWSVDQPHHQTHRWGHLRMLFNTNSDELLHHTFYGKGRKYTIHRSPDFYPGFVKVQPRRPRLQELLGGAWLELIKMNMEEKAKIHEKTQGRRGTRLSDSLNWFHFKGPGRRNASIVATSKNSASKKVVAGGKPLTYLAYQKELTTQTIFSSGSCGEATATGIEPISSIS